MFTATDRGVGVQRSTTISHKNQLEVGGTDMLNPQRYGTVIATYLHSQPQPEVITAIVLAASPYI